MICYHGMKGKIKIVEDSDGNKEYGFFRKNAKSKYYRISYADILVMKMERSDKDGNRQRCK